MVSGEEAKVSIEIEGSILRKGKKVAARDEITAICKNREPGTEERYEEREYVIQGKREFRYFATDVSVATFSGCEVQGHPVYNSVNKIRWTGEVARRQLDLTKLTPDEEWTVTRLKIDRLAREEAEARANKDEKLARAIFEERQKEQEMLKVTNRRIKQREEAKAKKLFG